MTTAKKCAREGFTLIEILIAVAIVGLMLAVVGPGLVRRLAGAKETAAKSQMTSFKSAITMYYIDVKRYPTKLTDLIKKPADPNIAPSWKGPYLDEDEIPLDPWTNSYKYELKAYKGHPYTLYSYGPNGKDAPSSEWIHVWK